MSLSRLTGEVPLPNSPNPDYIKGWNRVAKAIGTMSNSQLQIMMESYRDAANRNLLNSINTDVSQAVLDCTSEYIKSNKVPAEINI